MLRLALLAALVAAPLAAQGATRNDPSSAAPLAAKGVTRNGPPPGAPTMHKAMVKKPADCRFAPEWSASVVAAELARVKAAGTKLTELQAQLFTCRLPYRRPWGSYRVCGGQADDARPGQPPVPAGGRARPTPPQWKTLQGRRR